MLKSSAIIYEICQQMLQSKALQNNNSSEGPTDEKIGKLRVFESVFEKRGGVLAKVVQLCSIEHMNNPKVFSECKHKNKLSTHNSFIEYFNKNKNTIFKDIDIIHVNHERSGTIGQLYKCHSMKDGELIFKFQHDNIRKQFDDDFSVLYFISRFIYGFRNIKELQVKLKTIMYEELDYGIEIMNNDLIYDLWSHDQDYVIPRNISSLCSERLIAFEFIDGMDLISFIQKSSQEQRNKIGKSLFRFFFITLFKNNTIYSDIHYGNFLVVENCKLAVVDFGAIYNIEEYLVESLYKIIKASVELNNDDLLQALVEIGFLDEQKMNENSLSSTYICNYFHLMMSPFREEKFHFSDEFREACSIDHSKMSLLTLNPDCLMMVRVLFLYSIMKNMSCECDFITIYDEIKDVMISKQLSNE